MLRAADARAPQRFPRLLILILPSPVLIDELDAGLANYPTRMRFGVKDTYVRSSVSIADMPPKESLGAFVSKGEMHSRPKEIGLLSVTLGRNSILTWSHLMIKTPIAIAATAAVGLSFAQLALGQSDCSPTSIRYNG